MFNEINTIAVKIPKSVTGLTDVVLVNSRILDLVGRTVAYGNEDRNSNLTEAQVILRGRGNPQVDLSLFLDSDWTTFRVIDSNKAKQVKTTVQIGKYWRNNPIELNQSIATEFLFEVDGKRYLSGVLKRNLEANLVTPYTYQVPAKTKDIESALESLKPKEVVEAEGRGLTVRQAAGVYFIPVEDPVFRVFTAEEKLLILAGKCSHSLSDSMLSHITGMHIDHRADKRSDELLAYVPSPRKIGGLTASTALEHQGKTLAIGKVEVNNIEGSNIILSQWHQVIEGKHG
jgi:hypothetical protein